MPTPRVTPATRDAQIRACHAAGLTTDAAVGAALGVHATAIAYWRYKLNIPAQDVFPAHWDQRHGRGSYAALVRLVTQGATTQEIQERYHISKQYVSLLRQKVWTAKQHSAQGA